MAIADRRDRRTASAFAVGLALGAVLGVLGGRFTAHTERPDPWIDAGLVWSRLPAQVPAGDLPQTFATPALAYAYGAATKPLGPLLKSEPSILRIETEATAGRIGVSLVTPDGATLVSQEKALSPKDGPAKVYFRITPQTPPAIVVVRNYDDPGVAGSAVVRSASYAPQSSLNQDELSEVSKAGVQ